MSTFSINIFDEPDNNLSDKNSIKYSTPTFNPTFNSSMGHSNERIDFRPTSTSTSISAPDLLPLHNNSTNERFKQNQLLHGKTQFEQSNTIIKSLEEEIITMKHKLSFVYEKDEEISTLKDENMKYKKEINELKISSNELVTLRLENKQLQDMLNEQKIKVTKLLSKNKELEDKLTTNNKKGNCIIKNDTLLEEIEDIEGIDDLDEIDEIDDLDEIEENDNYIDININHLRSILFTRLKEKQMHHIEGLINTYGLKRKNKVKRSTMEKMLEQAIHL